MTRAEAESPHLEIISPPGGHSGLKEEARRNVVEILEKPERRSSDSSFTEAPRFLHAARVQLKWPESLRVHAQLRTWDVRRIESRLSAILTRAEAANARRLKNNDKIGVSFFFK